MGTHAPDPTTTTPAPTRTVEDTFSALKVSPEARLLIR